MKRRALLALIPLCILVLNGCGGSGAGSNPSPLPPPSSSTSNQWTWVSGSNLLDQTGSYGQQGVAASSNVPPARYGAATWTDTSGNMWLFGGTTAPTASSDIFFNDLWKFSNGQWTWVGGSSSTNQSGIYGTVGVPDPANIPGARFGAVTWKDKSGDIWLFGGLGLDASGRSESLNDLWRYSNGQWTWMGGPQTTIPGDPGVYGTKGVPAPDNLPGGRSDAAAWTDSSGHFWLFGGVGADSAGNAGGLNDLWRFSNGEWTWISGSSTINQLGVYGTQGTPGPTNVPGARLNASAWIDASGNLWLFGGIYSQQVGSGVMGHYLNDLWKYSNGQWTWMAGSNQPDQPGTYGTKGTPSATNTPGARSGAAAWSDSSGNFWLFSGGGGSFPNDLWKYSNGQWTWVGGSQTSSPGSYGTLGVASSSNMPGSRVWASSWTDQSGHLWLFGGDSIGASGGSFNDLWEYQP